MQQKIGPLFDLKKHSSVNFISEEMQKNRVTELFHSLKIFSIQNYTLDLIKEFLAYWGYNFKMDLDLAIGNAEVIHQYFLNENSDLYKFKPDVLLISLEHDTLFGEQSSILSKEDKLKLVSDLLTLITENFDKNIIMTTFFSTKFSDLSMLRDLNQTLVQLLEKNFKQIKFVDIEKCFFYVGFSESIDSRFWSTSRSPFSTKLLSILSFEILKIAKTLKGDIKKCLVLDCDNTLWGGVIGEEGIDGIALSSETYPGLYFYNFQKKILKLKEQGILLALNSKNNEEDVFDVLNNHKYCLLSKSDFVAFQINWDNKAENLNRIAEDLNIGLDSIVFVDDSSYECELVCTNLPQVLVYQIPKKTWKIDEIFEIDEPFLKLEFSEEDRNRTSLYLAEQRRNEFRAKHKHLVDYLNDLNLQIEFGLATAKDLPRVSQLTLKTNQFNLTTKRMALAEVEKFHESPAGRIFIGRTSDRFGEQGTTLLAIGKIDSFNCFEFEIFLMSCRVFERKLEFAFLEHCIDYLVKFDNCESFKASYMPTRKNRIASNFFENAGFSISNENASEKLYKRRSNENSNNIAMPNLITVLHSDIGGNIAKT